MRKHPLLIASLLFFAARSAMGQATSGNGITSDNSNPPAQVINLGATLTGHINFDLGAGYNFYFKKNSANYFTLLNNGNALFGAATDNGTLLGVNGSTYSKLFTNPTFAGDINAGALKLRWGRAGGSYKDFYNNSSTALDGPAGSGSEGSRLWIHDYIGVTFSSSPYAAIGAPSGIGDNPVLNVINNTGPSVNTLSVGRSGARVTATDNSTCKLQVRGTSYFSNSIAKGQPPD